MRVVARVTVSTGNGGLATSGDPAASGLFELQDKGTAFATARSIASQVFHLRAWDVSKSAPLPAVCEVILATALDGCWFVDGEGRFLEVNATYCEMVGYTRDELLAMGIPDVEAEESPLKVAAHIEKVCREGHDRFESRHRRKDGSQLDVEVSTTLLLDAESRVLVVFVRDISARKEAAEALERAVAERTGELERANEALRLIQRRSSVAMAGVDIAVFEQDRELRYRWMHTPQLGFRAEDVVGHTDHELLPQAAADRVSDVKRRVIESGQRAQAAVSVAWNDEIRWFDMTLEPLRDASGSVVGLTGATIDVTERMRAVEQLRRSEELYRSLASAARESIFVAGPDLTLEYVNPHGAATLGKSVDEVVGHSIGELFPLETVILETRELEQVFETGEPRDNELSFRMPHGEVWLQTHLAPLFDGSGKVRAVLGISRDVTQRRASEDRLRKLSRAVEQSPTSIIITNLDGDIEYVNPKFEKVTGYTAAEVAGKNPRLLKSGLTPESTYAELWEMLRSGREWRGELANQRKNGEVFWEDASISPITDAEGRVTHYLAVKEEITERKRAEAERARIEAELRQASKMEAVGQLAGGVAHDFNNMLAVIISYAELGMAELDRGDPLRGDIEEISRAAKRAAQLTQQLLAFSRKQVIAPRVVSVNDVLAEHEKMLGRLVGEAIRLDIVQAPDLWRVQIDPGQLGQVLVNLAANARDAIAGNGQIEIRTENYSRRDSDATGPGSAPAGDWVRISVRDDGAGMDPAVLERVFEPFFTTKPEGRGTGLGLASVYGIMKQNGGHIQVSSVPGAGTTFALFLPRSSGEPEARPTVPATSRSDAGSEMILLVEDEDQVLRLASRVLTRSGYRVLATDDPAEARDLLDRHAAEIDLLVTDVMMPGMSGRQLQLHAESIRPGIKTLFMSGYAADVVGAGGQTEAHFLSKPFAPADLTRMVRQALDEPSGA